LFSREITTLLFNFISRHQKREHLLPLVCVYVIGNKDREINFHEAREEIIVILGAGGRNKKGKPHIISSEK